MPLNLELKIALNSFDSVVSKLNQIEAEFISTLYQRDIYFSNKESLLKLRIENGSESLIRYKRNEKSRDRFSEYQVIYLASKGTEEFFSKIFKVDVVVEKKRLLYMYNNTRIHLDKIKSLGYYLELETFVLHGKKDAQKRFDEMVKVLNLKLENQIRKSNYNLMKSTFRK